MAQLNVQLLYLLIESEEVVDRNIVESVETLFAFGLAIRNSALYVDAGPDGRFRVVRGGRWDHGAESCRTAESGLDSPFSRSNNCGIRLVRVHIAGK